MKAGDRVVFRAEDGALDVGDVVRCNASGAIVADGQYTYAVWSRHILGVARDVGDVKPTGEAQMWDRVAERVCECLHFVEDHLGDRNEQACLEVDMDGKCHCRRFVNAAVVPHTKGPRR